MTSFVDKILSWHTADRELRGRFLEVFCANALDNRRYLENTIGPVLVLAFFWKDFPQLPLILWLITPPAINFANLIYTRHLMAEGPIINQQKAGLVFVFIAFLYAGALGGGFAYLYGAVSVEARVLLLILTWFGTGAVAITPYASIPGVMYARVIPVSICIVGAVALQGDWAFTAGVSIITLWVCFRLRYVQSYARTLESEYLLQRQLQEANEVKDRFLAVTSHEIRTPIHGILGLADVLAETGLDSKQRRYVEELKTAGEHLRGQLDDILDFSRLDAGMTSLSRQPISPRRIADDAISVIQGTADSKGLGVELVIDDSVPARVLGDEQAVRQVLSNLLGNAAKFSDRGIITLHLKAMEAGPGMVRLAFAVTDEGPGIALDDQKLIFDSFAQARIDNPSEHAGTGLGLAICRELAALMGGEVTLTSMPGAGATFTLSAPFEIAAAPDEPSEPSVAPDSASIAGLRILSVEDSELNRFVLREFLAPYDCVIEETEDAESALLAFQVATYDLIITDLRLPGMDGISLVARLRAAEGEAGDNAVPIIVLSASALPEDRTAAEAAGSTAFLAKPIRKRALVRAVQRLVGREMTEAWPDADESQPIEAELIPMLPRFIDEIRQSALDMDDAAAINDYAEVSRLAHQTRGHCRMFRFLELDAELAQLERPPEDLRGLNLSLIIASIQRAVDDIDPKILDGGAQSKNT